MDNFEKEFDNAIVKFKHLLETYSHWQIGIWNETSKSYEHTAIANLPNVIITVKESSDQKWKTQSRLAIQTVDIIMKRCDKKYILSNTDIEQTGLNESIEKFFNMIASRKTKHMLIEAMSGIE